MMAGVLFALAAARLQAAEPQFRMHVINSNSTYEACAVMDVNHDGKLDIVCGGSWYEAPDWKEHFVRNVEMINGAWDGYSHLEVDVNHDGWMDMINVNWRSGSIYWIEHPGASLGEWKKHMIATPGPAETGRLYDITGEGHQDILPNGQTWAAWWELLPGKPGSEPQFARHDLPSVVAGHGEGFGDINGDGRGDIVGPHGWLEAPVDRRSTNWIWHPEFELGSASIPIMVKDVNGDGLNDIVWATGHGYGVYWLEQTKEKGAGKWKKHVIDESWSVGHSPIWVDLLNSGKPAFVDGKRYRAHGTNDPGAFDVQVIYGYEFDRAKGRWDRYDIQTNGPAGFGLDPKAVDLDGDGDLDLVVPGRSGLYWFENLLTSKKPSP